MFDFYNEPGRMTSYPRHERTAMTAPLYVITGAMAAGKSTIAKAMVQRFEKSAHVGGDAFLRMITKGGAVMGPVLGSEAIEQLHLRQDMAMYAARRFVGAGFTTVYQDILIGPDFVRIKQALADLEPRIVVLNPDVETLARRDAERHKTGYGEHFPPNVLAEALQRDTPREGLWLDTSAMSVEAVVEQIIRTW
jgi:chloramphenicol 3-O-phosphotransferase